MNNMRRFLYLDVESINSYISQINDGLPTNIVENSKILNENSRERDSSISGEAELELKFFKNGGKASIDSSIADNNKKTKTFETSNSKEKKLYDDAFNKFENYLSQMNLLKSEPDEIGDFIKIQDEMFIIDLEYYKNIFSNDEMIEFIKRTEIEKIFNNEIEKIKESTPNVPIKEEQIKKQIKNNVDKKYKDLKTVMNLILNIVPYNKFGVVNDCLIVLDDEYFRDKSKVIAYKYGGKMTILGYITNISDSNNKERENAFQSFLILINVVMNNFFNKQRIKIIHPIAIYY